MSDATSVQDKGDHRPRVGRARRSRMRERLLHAVMVCYGVKNLSTTPTVDDIIVEADVVRSTFYRYFDSAEEAAICVARQLYDEMTESVNVMVREATSPLARVSVAFHLILIRCVTEPHWGAFYSQNFHLITNAAARESVGRYLAEARDRGLIDFIDLSAALGLLDGALTQGMDQIRRGCERPRDFIEDITRLCLRGLGVPDVEARMLVHDDALFIQSTAPYRLKWWRNPWPQELVCSFDRPMRQRE